MSNNKARRHTHKYYRADFRFGRVWACALPDCNHYMPQHMEDFVNGKFSICWQCGEQFKMNPISMKMDQPVCEECRLGKETFENVTEPPLTGRLAEIMKAKEN